MQFPNAAAGSKKIFTSELLLLLVAVLSGISAILLVLGAAGAAAVALETGELSGAAVGGIAVAGILGIVVAILTILALVLNIVGTVQCAKDEPAFKAVIIALLISVVLNLLAAIFASNTTLAAIVDIANRVISIFSTCMIISGFCNLAEKLHDDNVLSKGKTLMILITVVIVLQIILNIVSKFFIASAILAVVVMILSVVQYFLFLVFLGKSKKMLNPA